jgi:cytochrome c oxidase subunit 4
MDDVVETPTYLIAWIVELLLLGVNIGVAHVRLGVMNVVIEMSLAVATALILLAVFMKLRWDTPIVRVAAAAGFVWLALLFGGTMYDYLSRFYLPFP